MTDVDDFHRLAQGLHAMKYDFNYRKTKALLLPGEEITYTDEDQKAIIADDVVLDEANLLTSRHREGFGMDELVTHRIVLDIDHDSALIPSTTPGHFHLLIDVNIDWWRYRSLLRALADIGIIEQGYANSSIRRGYTAIRTPWEKKFIPQ